MRDPVTPHRLKSVSRHRCGAFQRPVNAAAAPEMRALPSHPRIRPVRAADMSDAVHEV